MSRTRGSREEVGAGGAPEGRLGWGQELCAEQAEAVLARDSRQAVRLDDLSINQEFDQRLYGVCSIMRCSLSAWQRQMYKVGGAAGQGTRKHDVSGRAEHTVMWR